MSLVFKTVPKTREGVILQAISAFRGSNKAAGMSNQEAGAFLVGNIINPALKAVDNNIVKFIDTGSYNEQDANTRTYIKYGAGSVRYATGSIPVR